MRRGRRQAESGRTRTLACGLEAAPACGWDAHGLKHFPYEGMARTDTRFGPARYTVSRARIQPLETETVRHATLRAGSLPRDRKTKYARDAAAVIGWDAGEDASWSYVECSGGVAGGRAYHGRPMRVGNPALGRLAPQRRPG